VNITEVRVKLVEQRDDKLHAFCTITIDNDFVVRDLKIIEGNKGLFVAMPSRKLTDNCPVCGGKNYLRARYCNECGARLDEKRTDRAEGEPLKLHADIAHPINSHCREELQAKVLRAYQEELERAGQSGYVSHDVEERPARDSATPQTHQAEPPAEPEKSSFEEGIFQ